MNKEIWIDPDGKRDPFTRFLLSLDVLHRSELLRGYREGHYYSASAPKGTEFEGMKLCCTRPNGQMDTYYHTTIMSYGKWAIMKEHPYPKMGPKVKDFIGNLTILYDMAFETWLHNGQRRTMAKVGMTDLEITDAERNQHTMDYVKYNAVFEKTGLSFDNIRQDLIFDSMLLDDDEFREIWKSITGNIREAIAHIRPLSPQEEAQCAQSWGPDERGNKTQVYLQDECYWPIEVPGADEWEKALPSTYDILHNYDFKKKRPPKTLLLHTNNRLIKKPS